MALADFFQTLNDLPISVAIREGESYFPWLESLHVLCIVTVVGTIAIIDLRLLGLPAHKRSVRQLTLELLPFTWVAFVLAVVFGSLLFLSNATTYAYNTQFQCKMALMLLAGLNMAAFHLVTQRNMHLWDELSETPTAAKVAGFSSLALWIGVVFFARWVGFTI
ncbi:MAG TPA: DUF6644 family protein [Sphingomonas sp.]|uniref:DUF6644 family protein n=1 Tax=Sphingomonas sp. TaxID=28214 RepID=UPI002C1389C0|nr:DUF6644 family protein [Sphingomonas sp.]HMI19153.1 DUF6644 family protein [Sphingomonas sp.]